MGLLTLLLLLASATTGVGLAGHDVAAEAQSVISRDGCQLSSSEGITFVEFGGTRFEYDHITSLDLDTLPGIEEVTTIEVGAGTATETLRDVRCGADEPSDEGAGDDGQVDVDDPDGAVEPDGDGESDGDGTGADGGSEDPEGVAPTLEEIEERCEKLDFELADATLFFEPEERMVLDVAGEVEAHIVLDEADVPQMTLEDDEGTRIRVSCTVEARLRGGEFSIDDEGWREENLRTASSVSWSWFVTPERLGEHRMTLEVRPVLLVGATESTGTTLREPRTVEVVDAGFGARSLRWLRQITEALRTVEGLLLALAAVLVAAGLLGKTWWRRRA
jgi:hypothetical protein